MASCHGGAPGNHVPKRAISKHRVRLKSPFSQDWTIITLTSEHYIQFVEKSLFISTTRGAHEPKIVPLKEPNGTIKKTLETIGKTIRNHYGNHYH